MSTGEVDQSHPNYWSVHLSNCARKGDLEGLQDALTHSANLEWREVPGVEVSATPLWWAATNGHIEAVQKLIDAGAHLEAKDEREGLTPLHRAAFRGFVDVVELLLLKGANLLARGKMESTPLHLAARGGKTEVVKTLLDWGASMELVNKRGETPLLAAVNLEVRRTMLEFEPTPVDGEPPRQVVEFKVNPFRKLEGDVAMFFECAIDSAWAHIDKCHEVYPYDLLIGAEKLLTLCKVGEAMIGYTTLEPSALNESCLHNIFATVSCCVRTEIEESSKKGEQRWRSLVLKTYESLYHNSVAKGLRAVAIPKITMDLWEAILGMLARTLFGDVYWTKKAVFQEQDAIRQRQMLAPLTKDFTYFRGQPPVVSKPELELAYRRLHALSPKGRALVSEVSQVLPEEYDYVRMTMRQLVFSLPETTRGKKRAAQGKQIQPPADGVVGGTLCHGAKEIQGGDLIELKQGLDWRSLDAHRAGMKRYWASLEDCCKRRVVYIPAREYHRCLTACEDWDILMSIHISYEDDSFIEYDEEKDAYTVGEEFLGEDGVDDMIDAYKADLENLWNDVNQIARLSEEACDELAMDLFELEARRLFCAKLFEAYEANEKEKTALESMEKLILEEEQEKKKEGKKKKKKKKQKRRGNAPNGAADGGDQDDSSDEDDDDIELMQDKLSTGRSKRQSQRDRERQSQQSPHSRGSDKDASAEERERVQREEEEERRALEMAMAESLKEYEALQAAAASSKGAQNYNAAAHAAAVAAYASFKENSSPPADEWHDVQKKHKRRNEGDRAPSPEPDQRSISNMDSDEEPDPARYKTRLCARFIATNKCNYGSKCTFAHGEHELQTKPHLKVTPMDMPKYKTKLCKSYQDTGRCRDSEKCTFAHGGSELRPAHTSGRAGSDAGSTNGSDAGGPMDSALADRVITGVMSILEGQGQSIWIAEVGVSLRQRMGRYEYENFIKSVGGLKSFLERYPDLFSLSGDFSRGAGVVDLRAPVRKKSQQHARERERQLERERARQGITGDPSKPGYQTSHLAARAGVDGRRGMLGAWDTTGSTGVGLPDPGMDPSMDAMSSFVDDLTGLGGQLAEFRDDLAGGASAGEWEPPIWALTNIEDALGIDRELQPQGAGAPPPPSGEQGPSDVESPTSQPEPKQPPRGSYAAAITQNLPPKPLQPPAPVKAAPKPPETRPTFDFDDGMVFVCTANTYQECMDRKLLGLPRRDYKLVASVIPEKTALFLFNFTTRELHGIFVAASKGGMNLIPEAWARRGPGVRPSQGSPFPAQLFFRIWDRCKPIPESAIRHLFKGNNRVLQLSKPELADVLNSFKRHNPQLGRSRPPTVAPPLPPTSVAGVPSAVPNGERAALPASTSGPAPTATATGPAAARKPESSSQVKAGASFASVAASFASVAAGNSGQQQPPQQQPQQQQMSQQQQMAQAQAHAQQQQQMQMMQQGGNQAPGAVPVGGAGRGTTVPEAVAASWGMNAMSLGSLPSLGAGAFDAGGYRPSFDSSSMFDTSAMGSNFNQSFGGNRFGQQGFISGSEQSQGAWQGGQGQGQGGQGQGGQNRAASGAGFESGNAAGGEGLGSVFQDQRFGGGFDYGVGAGFDGGGVFDASGFGASAFNAQQLNMGGYDDGGQEWPGAAGGGSMFDQSGLGFQQGSFDEQGNYIDGGAYQRGLPQGFGGFGSFDSMLPQYGGNFGNFEPQFGLCKICEQRPIEVVVEPCGHQAMCVQCVQGLTLCPLCRTQLTRVRHVDQ